MGLIAKLQSMLYPQYPGYPIKYDPGEYPWSKTLLFEDIKWGDLGICTVQTYRNRIESKDGYIAYKKKDDGTLEEVDRGEILQRRPPCDSCKWSAF